MEKTTSSTTNDKAARTDRRKRRRFGTASYFACRRRRQADFFGVSDRRSKELIGFLVDLSETGLQIVGNIALEPGVMYKLGISLPFSTETVEWIAVDAWCRWSRENESEGLFYTGLEIAGADPAEKERISQLLESW